MASTANNGDNKTDDITPPATAKLRLCFVIDEHRANSCKQHQVLTGSGKKLAGLKLLVELMH